MIKKKMTIKEAMAELNNAVEYYDMCHDTGDEDETKENKNIMWDSLDIVQNEVRKNKKIKRV